MTSVDSNFNFLRGRPPEPDPLPLRANVINGWPLIYLNDFSILTTWRDFERFVTALSLF